MNNQIRQAVSVILKYKNEVFVIKRQNYLRAFPGYTAFPGGKKDKKDDDLIATVKREINEELDFEITDQHKIIKFAKATSPDFNPARFEVYFYLVELSEKVEFNPDHNEAKEAIWIDPKEVISEWMSGQRMIVPPVRATLEKLVAENDEYIDYDENRFDEDKVPMIESICGIKQIMPLSHTVPPATRTNAFFIGDTLVDPSPKDEEEYQKLKNRIKDLPIKKIFITHHHGDHHQQAPELAKDFNVPLHISQDSHERILSLKNDYFKDVEVYIAKDGDTLTTWLDKKVKLYAIPGHDEGHLGFAPESLEWFHVGDLFQGVGTVVVGGAEGDMVKYFNSLKKVISLSPGCVIPSHGIALGGTNILEKTLEHRQMREDQVFEMYSNGKSIDDILNTLYFNIPAPVLKYARANIESHLTKLKVEGKIK